MTKKKQVIAASIISSSKDFDECFEQDGAWHQIIFLGKQEILGANSLLSF